MGDERYKQIMNILPEMALRIDNSECRFTVLSSLAWLKIPA